MITSHSGSLFLLATAFLALSCSSVDAPVAPELPGPADNKPAPDLAEEPACIPLPQNDSGRWFQDAIAYEVFVRSFYDSDGDGIGDFKGLTARLDYLNDGDEGTDHDLGVSLLWLMPISPSPSYHGYDVTEYKGVNPDYGTVEDFDEFMEEAHKRGIKVVVDLVMNHSSSEHPWFVSSKDPASPKRDWYVWSDEAYDWPRPFGGGPNTWHKSGKHWYYAIFWGGMPDLNYTTPAIRTEMADVADWWLTERKVDGFRLDAVRYLVEDGKDGLQDIPATLDYWKEFALGVGNKHPEALLVGEAWAANSVAAQYHGGGQGLNMTFDFDLMEAIIMGVQADEPADIEKVLCRFAGQFPPSAADGTFLTNHDLFRVAHRLKGDRDLMAFAPSLLFVLPGTPYIYYGQEIGMNNGPTTDDKHKRTPMQWNDTKHGGFTTGTPWQKVNSDYLQVNVAAQEEGKDSLLNLYRGLVRLRNHNMALRRGGFVPLETDSESGGPVWAFSRPHSSQTIVVAANFSAEPTAGARTALPGGKFSQAQALYPGETYTGIQDGKLLIGEMKPYEVRVVEIKE